MVRRDDVVVARRPLSYAGEPSRYAARWRPESPGTYLLEVWAYDAATGNTGIDRTSVIVTE